MNWAAQAIRDASRSGDYGKVVRLARVSARLTQRQLGEVCGITQSAVSRLEDRGTAGPYNMTILARAATHLGIPPRLVGLADTTAVRHAYGDGTENVERREFLAGALAAAAAPALPPLPPLPDTSQAATLRLATSAFRRMDGTTASRNLSETVLSHLRLIQAVAAEAHGEDQRARLAAVGSEAAGLAGWLSWDMGDYGSARTWYGSAIRAARQSGDLLLTAYQTGSLAQMEAHSGNGAQALSLVRTARRQLGQARPAIADAWLSTVEALAHAANGDERGTDRALGSSQAAAARIASEQPPPWPWVFPFSDAKVAACRISCGARLGRPGWIFGVQDDATEVLASGHAKQRALLVLDVATGHLAAGRLDAAFALATQAVETGLQYRSGRIIERARTFRRALSTATPPKVVREFDERLHGVYL